MSDMKQEVENQNEVPLAKGDTPDFRWYIAKAQTGQENKVMKSLKENIVNYKMTEFFSNIMVPEETALPLKNVIFILEKNS